MVHRQKLIVGNWKMNGKLTSGLSLAQGVVDRAEAEKPLGFTVVLCPPSTLLWPISETLMGTPVLLGGQNCHAANHGAYTGDISAGMLADLGCRYVILGHSERRTAYKETSSQVAQKAAAAQLAGLTTIICVGETLDERASGRALEILTKQLQASLPEKERAAQLVVAYEPIWAIGTGQTAKVEDIRIVHKALRKALGEKGAAIPILYGGSVSSENAQEILMEEEIDGVLVGSASLNAEGFWKIAQAAGFN